MLEACHDRHVLAEISVEQDYPRHIGALLKLFAQYRGGTVAAAVVDEHDLIADAESVERRIEPVEQGLQAMLLVIDGDDDGKLKGCIHGRHSTAQGRGSEIILLLLSRWKVCNQFVMSLPEPHDPSVVSGRIALFTGRLHRSANNVTF